MHFVYDYCVKNNLPTEAGGSRIEKACERRAERAREQYKQCCKAVDHASANSISPTAGTQPTIKKRASGRAGFQSETSGEKRDLTSAQKYNIRLRNNRKSAHASKVYVEVLRRELSKFLHSASAALPSDLDDDPDHYESKQQPEFNREQGLAESVQRTRKAPGVDGDYENEPAESRLVADAPPRRPRITTDHCYSPQDELHSQLSRERIVEVQVGTSIHSNDVYREDRRVSDSPAERCVEVSEGHAISVGKPTGVTPPTWVEGGIPTLQLPLPVPSGARNSCSRGMSAPYNAVAPVGLPLSGFSTRRGCGIGPDVPSMMPRLPKGTYETECKPDPAFARAENSPLQMAGGEELGESSQGDQAFGSPAAFVRMAFRRQNIN